MKEGAQPKFHKARRVPYGFLEIAHEAIQEMIQNNTYAQIYIPIGLGYTRDVRKKINGKRTRRG